MKRFKLFKIGFFIVFSLLIISYAHAGSLPDEWTEINPADYGFKYNGLTPACSNAPDTTDDEFTFFVKGGKKKNKNNLVIFFQGGGACWDVTNCVIAPTYTQYQEEELSMFSDDLEGYGIFDQTRKDNPFKDWGFVYIPYCTGDVFWGANDANYYGTEIQHRGFVNFQAVLTYLEENTKHPKTIFVTGSSAGSYGATLAFPYVKESFSKSKVYLLGDAGNGIMGGTFPTEGIKNWNVQMPKWIFPDGYDPTLTLEVIYTEIAAEYRKSPMAQYTTAFDGTQIGFYNVMLNIDKPYVWECTSLDLIGDWHNMMIDFAYNTAAASPNYRYYIATGTDHTILMSPKFYTEESAEGVSFAKWVKRMIEIKTPRKSRKWENLECENCFP
jgi:hypothetical protein